MRISDLSSDVCSSDLAIARRDAVILVFLAELLDHRFLGRPDHFAVRLDDIVIGRNQRRFLYAAAPDRGDVEPDLELPERSEEHTSELQSLMRISYAVFCLKKKTKKHKITYISLVFITVTVNINQYDNK